LQAYVTYLHYWWTKIKGYVLDLIFLFPWFHWIVLLCSSLSASSLQQLGDATMELSFHNAQRCFLLPTKSFILQLILQYAFLLSPLGCGKTNLMFHLCQTKAYVDSSYFLKKFLPLQIRFWWMHLMRGERSSAKKYAFI